MFMAAGCACCFFFVCFFSVAACNIAEKHCPDMTCKAQRFLDGRAFKCVCNTDLCNGNVTWGPDAREEPQHPTSYDQGVTPHLWHVL